MALDRDLTDDTFADVTGTADFMLDEVTVGALYASAQRITPEPDEQTWLVAYAVRARMDPSTLANLNPHDVPTRLGIFGGVPDP